MRGTPGRKSTSLGFHDRYVIKAFRTYLVELTKTRPTSTRCTAQVLILSLSLVTLSFTVLFFVS